MLTKGNVFLISLLSAALISACGGGSSTPEPVIPIEETPEPKPEVTPEDPPKEDPPQEEPPKEETPKGVAVSGNFTLQAETYVSSGGDGDIQTGNGDIVNWFNAGDYIEFEVNIDKAGHYEVTYRAASPSTNAIAELSVTNAQNSGLVAVGRTNISTGDWSVFEDAKGDDSFNIWHEGLNTIRITGVGSSDFQFNTDYIEFARIGDVDTSVDTDGDGVIDLHDDCNDTLVGSEVNNEGCAIEQVDSDNDGITDNVDLCLNTPNTVIADSTGCIYTSENIDVTKINPSLPSFLLFDNTTPAGKKWQKVESLSDEFNGEFDTAKWARSYWNYGVPNFNRSENSGVENGNLWIKATLAPDHETNERWFQTARVDSKAKMKFPVYTESRIRAASISAYNTYWLNNGDAQNRDEIDIIENNANPSFSGTSSNGQFVYDDYPWHMASQYFIVKNGVTERRSGDSDNRSDLSSNNLLRGVAWDDDYHVFGAWWKDQNTVQFYLNGEAVGSVQTTQPFTLEQKILFDLWTEDSAWVGGLPDKNSLLNNSLNTMYVDWVRTWKLIDE